MRDCKQLIEGQRNFFASQKTKGLRFRAENLTKLKRLIIEHQNEIILALRSDLNKSELDTYTTEIGILLKDIRML